MTKINRPYLALPLLILALTACFPMPVTTTPDETPAPTYQAEECPCPVFAIQDHPEDPGEAPGEWCLARSRTGAWMDAREHPACQREALGRKGLTP